MADIFLSIGSPAMQPVGATQVVNGVPRRRYMKEIIRAGQFVKDPPGQKFTIKRPDLDRFVAEFQRMKANGVAVPIPATHEDAGDSDKNRGYVEDMFLEGDSIVAIIELIGEDALLSAERNDVSIYSPGEYVDGKGNKYDRPIQHVAFTPEPVVPGLGPWIPIAASRDKKKKAKQPVSLSRSAPVLDFLNALAEALSLSKFDDEDKAKAAIVEAVTALSKKVAEKADDKPADDKKPDAKPESDAKPDPEKKDVAASRSADPIVVKLLSDNRALKLAELERSGKITPARAKALRERYIGDGNKAVALALSRGDDGSAFDEIVAALAENAPVVPKGERTGAQANVALSREAQNGDGTPKKSGLEAAVERRIAAFEASQPKSK